MRIIVFHGEYGCDTGCCGHYVEIDGRETFAFDHPKAGESPLEFAQRLVTETAGAEHVADLDWDNCVIEDN